MKQNRDIINKKLIPELAKSLGKSAMSYRLGGSLATSYNNSDVYNFDKKDEGDIEIADPERSYLTTTLYPISSKDAISSGLTDQVTGRFTDNLYASLGDAENYSLVTPTKLDGIFKVALKEYYVIRFSEEYAKNSHTVYAKTLTGILRDVLKKYEINKPDNTLSKATKITMSMRSVLIKYEYYKEENIKVTPTLLKLSSTVTLDGSFESYIPFDAEQRIIKEEVPAHSEIEDKASVTWSKTGAPIVQNSTAKEGSYSLYLDGAGTSIKSQESLEYKPSDSESLIIENWLKPDTMTSCLLTRYGGNTSEKGLYYDYALNNQWLGASASVDSTSKNYLFNTASHYLENTNSTALAFKTNATNPEGQTLELNVKVSTTSTTVPLTLLSNKVASWNPSPVGACASIVYYGSSFSNASYAGRVAVLTDNTSNTTEANGCLLISGRSYTDGSVLNISIVTYGNYIRLFVNGKLEAFAVLTAGLNFSQNGSYINKCNWKLTPVTFSYTLYALRFNNMALYTSDYTPSNVYSPRAIPKIKSLSSDFTYPEGIACGVRYLPNTDTSANDKTIIYASLSDGENIFTAESTPIDPLKWNNIKLSIYKNTLILYINGIAYSSEIIPFDIELETITVGSSTTTNLSSSFSGYIDNFKMYKDETFDLEGVKYVDVRPILNGTPNSTLEDFNPEIIWSTTTTPTISSNALAGNILGSLINTTTTNPKITTDSIVLDTQNFGIRTYIIATESQSSTIVKIGFLTIKINGLDIVATTNDQVFITTPIAINTLYKIDLRYNRGTIKLSINNVDVEEPIETTLNTRGTFYYGWDGTASLFKGHLGPLSIFDNNRNRIPAMDMSVEDFTTEKYYENTVLSLTGRDNVYNSDDRYYFDNGYSEVLNDVQMTGSVVNSTLENGLYFPRGSYLKVPSNSNFKFGTKDFTIEFNVKTSVIDRRQVIVDRYFSGIGSWQTSINTDGNLYFTVTNSDSNPYYYFLSTTNQKLNDGHWHKVFVIRKGLEIIVYVDNKLSDKFGMTNVFDFSAEKDLYIGHQGSNNNTAYDFEGYLNNIRITKGSLRDEITPENPNINDVAIVINDAIFANNPSPSSIVSGGYLNKTWNNTGVVFDSSTDSGFSPEVGTGSLYIADSSKTLSSVINLGQGNWSICFDMKMNTASDTGYGVPIMWFGSGGEGAQGFALESFSNHGSPSIPHMFIRKAYSSMSSGIVMPLGQWFKVVISKSNNTLSLKINDQTVTMDTTDFINEQLLTIGNYSGNWLQNRPFHIDNFRTYIGTYSEAYVSTALVDPYKNPKVEVYSPTLFTEYTKSLRTFDSNLTGDTVSENIWVNNGAVLSTENACKSAGSLLLSGSTYQATTGSQYILKKDVDFCIEASVFLITDTNIDQVIFSRGTGIGTLSYSLSINRNTSVLKLMVHSTGSVDATVISVPYKFSLNRWYEIACCNKGGVIFFIINGIRYDSEVQLTEDFYQGESTNDVYLGKSRSFYLNGYIDSFKLSVGHSVYTKGLGSDAAYLAHSVNLTTLTQADTVNVPSLIDTGIEKLQLSLSGVSASKTVVENGEISSAYFGQSSSVTDSSGSLLNFKTEPFTVLSRIRLIGTSGKRYLLKSADTDKISMNVYIGEDGKVTVEIRQNGEVLKAAISSISVPIGKWSTIGIVRTELNVLRLYINGFVVSTLNNTTDNFETLGSECSVGFSTESITSYISYVNVYKNKVITPKAGENIINLMFDNELITNTTLTDNGNPLLKYSISNVLTEFGIDGKYTASAFFNGLTSSISIPGIEEMLLSNEEFDIEFEVFPTDGTNKVQTILSTSDATTPLRVWLYGSNFGGSGLNNRIGFGTDTNAPVIKSTTALYFDKWTFVRITRDGDQLKLYLDGVLDASITLSNETFNFAGNLLVGRAIPDGQDSFLKGYLSSLKVSSGDIVRTINTDKYKVISALDFENSSTELVVYDYDVNPERFDRFRHTWSIIKYQTTSAPPILKTITTNNEAAYFNGTSGFIYKNKNTHVSFKPFTLELKFMATATNNSNARYIIDQSGLYAIKLTTDKRVEFNGGSVILQSPVNSILNNKWYHVAVTRDENKITRLFLDGVKVGESSSIVNYSEVSHYPICLGMYYNSYTSGSYLSYNFEGFMDNFYMINGTCKYTENFIPNIPNDTVLANTSLAYVVGSAFKDVNTNITWSVSNMSVSATKVKNKASAMFSNSTSGYLQSTNNEAFKAGFYDFTIDLIVCPSQIISPTTLFDNRTDVTLARGLTITQPTGNTASFTLSVGSSLGTTDWDVSLNTGINSIASGTYYHLRITRNLGKIYLFLDGVLKASADYVNDIPSSGVFVLGNRISKNQGFTGYIEQFRYLDRTSLAGTTFAPFKQELI